MRKQRAFQQPWKQKERSGSSLVSHPLLSYVRGSILWILCFASFVCWNILGVPALRSPAMPSFLMCACS